jgi:DNA polymerase I-like protein with 3'-5' exonuclease and polymerase domains
VAETLNTSVGHAASIKSTYLAALPEIKDFQKELSEIGRSNRFTTTLGGRQYYVQTPAVVQGKIRTFEYKLPNYKIQGSAADQSKKAMIDFYKTTKTGQIILTVHDQLVIQCPIDFLELERETLRKSVNGSFQSVLKYEVRSDEAVAYNFAELK